MDITVGTFNLNNLFSRFDFQAAIDELSEPGASSEAVAIRYEFTDPEHLRVRTFLGKLVKAKDLEETAAVARRIRTMDVDVLAVQEVENINVLRSFNKEQLGGLYRHAVLIEGNDPRFIDVGLLSKLPVGAITSHQTAEHDEAPGMRVFGRDLLQADGRANTCRNPYHRGAAAERQTPSEMQRAGCNLLLKHIIETK